MRAPRIAFIMLFAAVTAGSSLAEDPPPGSDAKPAAKAKDAGPWRKVDENRPGAYLIEAGTKVPLALINSVSTKHSAEGDRVYLETVFPIVTNGRIVIPPGSYVAGTVTEVKRPGRVKGRGELFLRFDSLTLPNGITRDFRARI